LHIKRAKHFLIFKCICFDFLALLLNTKPKKKPLNAKEGGLGKGSVAGIVVAVLVIVIVAVSAFVWRHYKGFTLCRKSKERSTNSLPNGNGYQAIVSSEDERV